MNNWILLGVGDKDQNCKINTSKKVGIIESDGYHLHGELFSFSTSRLLSRLGVKYKRIKNFGDLSEYDVIVIAPGQFGEIPVSARNAIVAFVKNGGILVSWLISGIGIAPAGTFTKLCKFMGKYHEAIGLGGDVMTSEHPLLEGISNNENWRDWSADQGKVYTRMAFPLKEGVIVSGGSNGATPRFTRKMIPTRFGMLVAEIPMGKGRIIISQAAVSA